MSKAGVTLSRFFDGNVRLVAGVCSRCYLEDDDVKIVAVNRKFLEQVEERRLHNSDHCQSLSKNEELKLSTITGGECPPIAPDTTRVHRCHNDSNNNATSSLCIERQRLSPRNVDLDIEELPSKSPEIGKHFPKSQGIEEVSRRSQEIEEPFLKFQIIDDKIEEASPKFPKIGDVLFKPQEIEVHPLKCPGADDSSFIIRNSNVGIEDKLRQIEKLSPKSQDVDLKIAEPKSMEIEAPFRKTQKIEEVSAQFPNINVRIGEPFPECHNSDLKRDEASTKFLKIKFQGGDIKPDEFSFKFREIEDSGFQNVAVEIDESSPTFRGIERSSPKGQNIDVKMTEPFLKFQKVQEFPPKFLLSTESSPKTVKIEEHSLKFQNYNFKVEGSSSKFENVDLRAEEAFRKSMEIEDTLLKSQNLDIKINTSPKSPKVKKSFAKFLNMNATKSKSSRRTQKIEDKDPSPKFHNIDVITERFPKSKKIEEPSGISHDVDFEMADSFPKSQKIDQVVPKFSSKSQKSEHPPKSQNVAVKIEDLSPKSQKIEERPPTYDHKPGLGSWKIDIKAENFLPKPQAVNLAKLRDPSPPSSQEWYAPKKSEFLEFSPKQECLDNARNVGIHAEETKNCNANSFRNSVNLGKLRAPSPQSSTTTAKPPFEPLWSPPRSPHNLIEESLFRDPWALLVATIFLNKTSCKNARPRVAEFLRDFAGPQEVLQKPPEELEKYFMDLGLFKRRAEQVWRMSHDFVHKDWRSAKELYGIGKYGEDAYRIFILGDLNVEPSDRFLRIYRDWARMRGKEEKMAGFSSNDQCGGY